MAKSPPPIREQYGSAGAGAIAVLVILNILWAGANPAALVMMQNHRPEWVAAFRFIGAGTMLALLLAIPAVRQTLAPRLPATCRTF